MQAYASYYSKDFQSDGLDKKEWVQRKKSLAMRYKHIDVTGRDFQVNKIKVNKSKYNIHVRFLQDYKSSGFSATGIKTLIFINEDKEWKIYRENWKKR